MTSYAIISIYIIHKLLLHFKSLTHHHIEQPVADFAQEFFEFRLINAPEYATKFGIEVDDESTRSGVTDIGDAAVQTMLVRLPIHI